MQAKAQARFVRISPPKARMVVDQIRGKRAVDAIDTLRFSEVAAAEVVEKVLHSAIANAERVHGVSEENLVVGTTFVDEGPTLKRIRARAKGSAARINKRTCHITVIVNTPEEAKKSSREEA